MSTDLRGFVQKTSASLEAQSRLSSDNSLPHSQPLTNAAMKQLIVKTIHKDAIIDVLIDDWIDIHVQSVNSWALFHNTPKLEQAKDSLLGQISTKLEESALGAPECNLDNRIEQRVRYTWGRHLEPDDDFLDEAREVLRKSTNLSSYTQWPDLPQINTRSLHHQTEMRLLRQLQEAIDGNTDTFFACGGEFPIQQHRAMNDYVDIRWGSPQSRNGLARFPLLHASSTEVMDPIEQLLSGCDAAKIGGDGDKELLDESYCKAARMDEAQFCTNFRPENFSILDVAAKFLFPGTAAIIAKLFELRVYSGASGRHRPYFDGRQGECHIASLVVCLPSVYEGGALIIRHEQGNKLVFDWNANDSNIKWAAYRIDCSKEVEQVRSGHRVTLEYELWAVAGRPSTINHQLYSIFTPSQTVLYKLLNDMLAIDSFLRRGQVLGVFCVCEYDHTSASAQQRFPNALEGPDFVVYAVCRALGLPVKVAPILMRNGGYGGITLEDFRANRGTEVSASAIAQLQNFQQQGNSNNLRLRYEGEDESSNEDEPNHYCRSRRPSDPAFETRVERLMTTRCVKGLSRRQAVGHKVVVGTDFTAAEGLKDIEENGWAQQFWPQQMWPHKHLPSVLWMNKPHRDAAKPQLITSQ
ncbi:MAG: hypothetical protein Q9210_004216, partial [Variospora velana]